VVETATAQAEWAILGLRLTEGLDGAVIRAWPSIARALDGAAGQGLVERIRGRVGLTQRGRALSNEVFAHLLPASTTQTATPT
jgi:coproporphyrinogen III oxidase-like Fe-S oxidoreductase